MDFKVLKKLIISCAQTGVEEVNFEGGEVVLYPHIIEAFHLVDRLKMSVTAYTHLAYGREHLDSLRLASRLTVNLSAPTRAAYRRIHGADRFADVISNLRLLIEMRKKYGRPLVDLTFIITERNYKEIEALLDLADTLKVDRVVFRLFEATVELKSLLFSSRSAEGLKKIIDKAFKAPHRTENNLGRIREIVFRERFLEDQHSIMPTQWHNDRLFYSQAVSDDRIRCYMGFFYSFVDEKGRVIAPCDNIGICVAGNISKSLFNDIWFHSKKLNKIRQEAKTGIDIRQDRWRECRYCGNVVFNKSVDMKLSRSCRERG